MNKNKFYLVLVVVLFVVIILLSLALIFVNPKKVQAPKQEFSTITLYFYNQNIKPVDNCKEVVPVTRQIPKTEKIATATLEQLLGGPTAEEKKSGYTTVIPEGSKLNSLNIVDGEAQVDFNEATQSGGGSCSMLARVTQIRQTLLQFSTIKTIKLSINGATEPIFQP